MPEGAMANCTSVGVGRISHVILECRDLQHAADLFASYGGIELHPSTDMSAATLVLRTAVHGIVCGHRSPSGSGPGSTDDGVPAV
jgi:hypothetical protein